MSKVEIRAPMPGVFYRKPSPDSPPFKVDGDDV
ncbi:MAG: biotin carboxyl carrier domain-containing protein, partial [Nitratireductor sp.]